MEYSVVGDDAWVLLASVDYSPFTSTTSSDPAYSRSTLLPSTEFLATGVDAIRFIYDVPTISGGGNAGVVIQEIDVEGVPTTDGILIENTSNSVAGGAGLEVSSTDLVNQNQPTLVNHTSTPAPHFGPGTVNDGTATNLTSAAAFYRTGSGQLPAILDFNLDVSVHTAGYDITQIDSFAGWEGGGTQTYGNQKFTVAYSMVGDPGFVPLTGVDYSPFSSTTSNDPAYSRSRITRTNGVLAGGVDAIRFIYDVPATSGGVNGGVVIQEIDIHGVASGPDNTPPSPDPMTFATAPYASGATSISMTATTAIDSSGVEYYFAETSGNPGGTDSGWQSGASYENTGLTTGLQYIYTVTARDLSANQNHTASSSPAAATAEDTPGPPSVVTITTPASRHIVQRSAGNTGVIAISGTYTNSPSEIQARAVVMAGEGNSGTTTDWQTIVPTPDGGSFIATLIGVPAGGWYQLEMRGLVGTTPGTVTIREKIGVGDIYVTCGQSNSANHGTGGYVASDDRVSARTAVTGTTWIAASDPIPIASGSGGSPWTRLGDLLAAAENIPIGFLAVGVGSTQVSQWLPGTSNYNNRLKPAIQSLPSGGFRAVLWHQGESDALANVSAVLHASRLNSMISQSRTDAGWNVPWYLAEASFHPSSNLSQEEPVAAGQRLAAHGDPLVFLGPSTDPFHLEDAAGGKLNDSVHFNAAGLLDHARQWSDILRDITIVTPRNGNFEDNRNPAITGLSSLADNASHIVTTTSNNDSPSVLGWRILSAGGETAADGGNGFHNPGSNTYAAAADTTNNGLMPNMDGRHVAMLDGGAANNYFLHSTRALTAPQTTYTLTVALGVRDIASGFGNARLEITANGVMVSGRTFTKSDLDALRGGESTGTFTNASISWTTGGNVVANQPIAIRIIKPGGLGTVLDFDNVRLVSTATPFASWQIDNWGDITIAEAAWNANPDGDFLDNIFEYHLGLDPRVRETPEFLSEFTRDGKDWFRYQIPLNPAVDSTGLNLWVSFDLETWQLAASNSAGTLVNHLVEDSWSVEVSTTDHPQAYFRLSADRAD